MECKFITLCLLSNNQWDPGVRSALSSFCDCNQVVFFDNVTHFFFFWLAALFTVNICCSLGTSSPPFPGLESMSRPSVTLSNGYPPLTYTVLQVSRFPFCLRITIRYDTILETTRCLYALPFLPCLLFNFYRFNFFYVFTFTITYGPCRCCGPNSFKSEDRCVRPYLFSTTLSMRNCAWPTAITSFSLCYRVVDHDYCTPSQDISSGLEDGSNDGKQW